MLETERRCEILLAKARSESEQIVREAADGARREDAIAARDLEQAARHLRGRLLAEREREQRAIAAEARRAAQRLDDVPDCVVEQLAERVVMRLIEEGLA